MATYEVPLSSDDVFEGLLDKDKTVELVGYVSQVQAAQEVGKVIKYLLLKFTLSSKGGKKVQCLIWGKELIGLYESELTLNRKVHLDGAHCKVCTLTPQLKAQDYVPFELIVQASTVVTCMDIYEKTPEVEPIAPQRVTFENINAAEGLISIDGYIKTKFVVSASRYENASYGRGSITDGSYKVTVHIINYVPIDVQKGTAVNIIGQVNTESIEPLTITCKDMSGVCVQAGVDPLPLKAVFDGNKTPKRKLAPL